MPQHSYSVGQILYVLTHKETKIYPIQIVEEIIKRTVNGETISYIAKIGKNEKTVSLSDIEGDFYEDVENLRSVLTQRVMNTVNNIIDSAVTKSDEWYSNAKLHSPIIDPLQQREEQTVVVLPDGKVANLRLKNNISE